MIKKISDQDKKDWKKFIESDEKLENKDIDITKLKKKLKEKTIDLHGYTLENANIAINDFINKCYLEGTGNIKVITGIITSDRNVTRKCKGIASTGNCGCIY